MKNIPMISVTRELKCHFEFLAEITEDKTKSFLSQSSYMI